MYFDQGIAIHTSVVNLPTTVKFTTLCCYSLLSLQHGDSIYRRHNEVAVTPCMSIGKNVLIF